MRIRARGRNQLARERLYWFAMALTGAAVWLTASSCTATATDAQALLHAHKCYMCHADNTWKTGPAFRDVAASYRTSRKPANTMVRLIRQGQHGEGPWHMPPHSEASLADAKAMADYILSLP